MNKNLNPACEHCDEPECFECFDGSVIGVRVEESSDIYEYYRWLIGKTGVEASYGLSLSPRKYTILLNSLFNIEFYSLLPLDDNRAQDGIALREQFLLNYNKLRAQQGSFTLYCDDGEEFIYTPDAKLQTVSARINGIKFVPQSLCSVLEMIIALASRIAFNVDKNNGHDYFKDVFWELIGNLGLLQYHNDVLNIKKLAEIHERIDRFLERRYRKDGKNGLFPLKNWYNPPADRKNRCPYATVDQRTIDIAKQMAAYMDENYI